MSIPNQKIYDLIGIGIGPFNLGLAALTQPIQELSCLFFDQSDEFNWHPGLMLEDATLQVPFMADLVTMADPANPFSFLNFLKQTDRLYKFYIRENFFMLRKEYNAYCRWVVEQLPNCRFSHRVVAIAYEHAGYTITVRHTKSGETTDYYTRKLVLGTGTQPYIPPFLATKSLANVIHTSQYLYRKEDIQSEKSVTIVGSGQSAAEVFMDLLPETKKGLHLNWLTRSARFFPLENHAKLTLELTSPEYMDYFHGLSGETRKGLLTQQTLLYKGINYDLINHIYNYLYTIEVAEGKVNVTMMANSKLEDLEALDDQSLQLSFSQVEQGELFELNTDFVVLATGYKYTEPEFLRGITQRINRDENGQFQVERNYSIDRAQGEIFVQNAELHTHGFGAPDLGMGAYRNAIIINQIIGKEVYKVEKRIAFQNFSADTIPKHRTEPLYS